MVGGPAVGREFAQVCGPRKAQFWVSFCCSVEFARAAGSSLHKERYLFPNRHFKTNSVASLKNLFFKIEVYSPISTTEENEESYE